MLAQGDPFGQAQLHQVIERAGRVDAVLVGLACRQPGEQFQRLLDMLDGIDVEFALARGIHHRLLEHQVAQIAARDDHALFAAQAAFFAQLEETLDLFAHPADGLHLAVLVDRAGDGQ